MNKEELQEELKSADTYPSGPVSAWPESRHWSLMESISNPPLPLTPREGGASVTMPSATKMVRGLVKTTGQMIRHGKVLSEIREERYDTCKSCPFFNAESKRCNDCGCFMEAKTWVGGNPDTLCPQKKWSR